MKTIRTGTAFLLTAFIGPAILPAQEAVDEGNVFELSAFVVNTDAQKGYVASSSVSASRAAAQIKEIPFTINVVTNDFLEDINADDINEAIQYSSNIVPADIDNGSRFAIRGLQVKTTYRNGLRTDEDAPVAGVERVEILKGPASILYGNVTPGGIVNYITKRPLTFSQAIVELKHDTWGTNGVQLDYSTPLGDSNKAYARVVGSWQDGEKHLPNTGFEEKYALAAVTLYPVERLRVEVSFDYLDSEAQVHPGMPLLWEPRPADSSELGTAELVYDYAYELGDFDMSGGEAFRGVDRQMVSTEIEYRVNDVLTLIGYHNFSVRSGDTLKINGSRYAPPGFADRFPAGTQTSGSGFYRFLAPGFRDARGRNIPYQPENAITGVRYIYTDFESKLHDFRADGLLEFSTGRIDHKLLIGMDGSIGDDDLQGAQLGGKATSGSGYDNIYLDGFPAVPVPGGGTTLYTYRDENGVEQTIPEGADPWSAFKPLGESGDFLNTFTAQAYTNFLEREYIGFYVREQATMMDGKFIASGGLRYSMIDLQSDSGSTFEEEEIVPQIGLLYKIQPETSVYVSYSESFEPVNQFNEDGEPLSPELGVGYDAGIKTTTLDGRLNASFSVFYIERRNIPRTTRRPSDPNDPSGDLENIRKSIGVEEAQGFEVELAYRPQDNWDILFNVGYVDSETAVGEDDAARDLDVRPGTPIPEVPDLTLALWTRYNIEEGPLEGAYIGLGATHIGDRRKSIRGDQPIVIPAYERFDLLLGYETELRNGMGLNFSVNIENIFDESYFVYSAARGMDRNASFRLKITF
jgi:iron complex outermembrane receptor protein